MTATTTPFVLTMRGQHTPGHLHAFRLAAFVRAWYGSAAERTIESRLADCTYNGDALDCLFGVLGEAWYAWIAENGCEGDEPTLEQVCECVAVWGLQYMSEFGARVIDWDTASREVLWGSATSMCGLA